MATSLQLAQSPSYVLLARHPNRIRHVAHSTSRNCSRAAARAPLGVRAEVQYFSAEDAKKAVEQDNYVLLDIRDEKQYSKAHIKGSTHIPLFVENKDMDIATIIRRQAHNNFAGFLFGQVFTKPNESFVANVEKAVGKEKKVLVVCQEGLRSSSAAEKLDRSGFSNVAMLVAGLNKLPPGVFQSEGQKELQKAGIGGFVSIQTQFSIVLGSFLFGCILFIQFFPETARPFLGPFGNLPTD